MNPSAPRVAMVDMLLHNGADPTIRAPLGETALYIAASRNYVHAFVKKTSAPVFPFATALTACARVRVWMSMDVCATALTVVRALCRYSALRR